jgi:geranylgeranylglycerol-phosphate geranylgeranyltransferase
VAWYDYARLVRGGNMWMAAFGVVAGALLLGQRDVLWDSVFLAAVVAAVGVAGGNAWNDARDAAIDAMGHPDRPIPRGNVSVKGARRFAAACFGLALLFGFAESTLVGATAALLILWLAAYELLLKERGLVGNVWVSGVVAATFLLGAFAAKVPIASWTSEAWVPLQEPRLAVVGVFALLALLANAARELFKDVQDMDADRGRRRTFPLQRGARRAMYLARSILALAIVLLTFGFVMHPDMRATLFRDDVFLLPAVAVFVVAISRPDARAAQRWTKGGMAFALVGFALIGWY